VIEDVRDVEKMPSRERFGVISQTTQPIECVQSLVAEIRRRNPKSEVRFVDTVCRPTKDRQLALQKLLGETDAIVVVGGKTSNNTRQLVEACQRAGKQAFHIERADELQTTWFEKIDIVGLTAGTSTLPETVSAVHARLREISSAKPKQ